jgi:hypothetical protein
MMKRTAIETIEDIIQHHREDCDEWAKLPQYNNAEVRAKSAWARCIGERAWLLRRIGHLPESKKD